MSGYNKWLGGSLGWLVGGPIGGILGFVAGNMLGDEPEAEAASEGTKASELEACLMVMASHIINADENISFRELDAVRKFLKDTAGEENLEDKMKVLNHCLNHSYDLEKACGYIRIYQNETVAYQALRFMYDVAISDAALSEKERRLIFYMAGLMNINDVVYRRLMDEWVSVVVDDYALFNLTSKASHEELRFAYRKLVLKIHPDRNAHYTEEERKAAEIQLQELREAYERLMR